MSALDRALIKAYHRPVSRSGNAVAEPPAAVPPDARLRVAVSSPVPLSRALAELAAAPANLPSTSGRGAGGEGGLEPTTLPSTSGRGAGGEGDLQPSTLHRPLSTVHLPPPERCEGGLEPVAAEPSTDPVGPSIAALLDTAFQATTVSEPTMAPVGPSIAALADQAFPATTVAMEIASPAEIGKSTPAETLSRDETAWRPLLQVDCVVWPSIHARLQSTAPAAIQQMSDGLLGICASGCKLLGLASCARGEGVTTLLLAAAQTLVGQGRKVVLVDANGSNPRLAQSLGLLPQIGWEETLCGGLPLEEVVIESLADGLAVLPVRGLSAGAIAQGQIAASFDILAREFDVVLVDLGPLDQVEDEDSLSHDVAARMDALILVQNVRLTTPNRLADVRRRLAASNLRYAGTIQNFVAG